VRAVVVPPCRGCCFTSGRKQRPTCTREITYAASNSGSRYGAFIDIGEALGFSSRFGPRAEIGRAASANALESLDRRVRSPRSLAFSIACFRNAVGSNAGIKGTREGNAPDGITAICAPGFSAARDFKARVAECHYFRSLLRYANIRSRDML